jgi:hypothetical protein
MAERTAPSDQPDYLPYDDEFDDLEDLFGALLVVGHTVRQAADFMIMLGNGEVD